LGISIFNIAPVPVPAGNGTRKNWKKNWEKTFPHPHYSGCLEFPFPTWEKSYWLVDVV